MVYPLFISLEIEQLMEEGFIISLLIGNILDLTIFHSKSCISNKLYRFGYGKNDLFTFIKFFSFMPKNLNEKLNIGVRSILKEYLSKYPEDKNMLLTEIGVPPTIIEFDLEEIFDITLY